MTLVHATAQQWDQIGAIRRAADELATLLDDFRPTGPLQRLDVTTARNCVAAVTASLDRMTNSIRKGSA